MAMMISMTTLKMTGKCVARQYINRPFKLVRWSVQGMFELKTYRIQGKTEEAATGKSKL
jgi:hypothetical protein